MKEQLKNEKDGSKKPKYCCKDHKDKKIKYYCFEEDIFMCSKCLPKHFEHVYQTKEISPYELADSIQELT